MVWNDAAGAQGEEAFKCEVCNEKCEATKRLRLFRLPQVLLLHIKRFKYTGSSREKLTNNVTFPIKVCTTVPAFCLHLCPFGALASIARILLCCTKRATLVVVCYHLMYLAATARFGPDAMRRAELLQGGCVKPFCKAVHAVNGR